MESREGSSFAKLKDWQVRCWKYFSPRKLFLTNVHNVAKIIPTVHNVTEIKTLGKGI